MERSSWSPQKARLAESSASRRGDLSECSECSPVFTVRRLLCDGADDRGGWGTDVELKNSRIQLWVSQYTFRINEKGVPNWFNHLISLKVEEVVKWEELF